MQYTPYKSNYSPQHCEQVRKDFVKQFFKYHFETISVTDRQTWRSPYSWTYQMGV